ncbi:MAG: MBL fold metallo-hydrolase, partial [Bacteroidota bacterium]
SLLGRNNALNIYGPTGIKTFIEQSIQFTHSHLSFPLNIHELDATQHTHILRNETIDVYTIPLQHRVPCCGYLFREIQRLPRINTEKITAYNIPNQAIRAIKMDGIDYILPNGRTISNAELTLAPYPSRAFAYCSDTAYHEPLIPIIQNVDLLYHEATYLERHAAQAVVSMHSTAKQAASIAQQARAKRLILGHYSSRYSNIELLRTEAETIFTHAELGIEGRTYVVPLERT